MGRRWHYSTQSKAEAPVDSSRLRRLARDGVLKPDDLVRKQGSRCWVKAKRIQGLFSSKPKWSYQHRGETHGPVSDRQLRSLATARMIGPTDLVWRDGLPTWIEARRLRGLFPSEAETSNLVPHPATRPRISASKATILRWAGSALLAMIVAIGAASMLRHEAINQPAVSEPTRPFHDPVASIAPPKTTQTSPVSQPTEVQRISPPVAPIVIDETTIGLMIHERFMRDHKALDDARLSARVKTAAEPILKRRDRKTIDYHFTILDSDAVDAFSHAGGYIYLTKGLFSLVADEAELGFVMGHEIAHIDLKHGGTSFNDVEVLRTGVGAARPEADEYAADEWARRRLAEAGFAPFESLSFLRRYSDYRERQAVVKSNPSNGFASHWASAPEGRSRVKRLESLASKEFE